MGPTQLDLRQPNTGTVNFDKGFQFKIINRSMICVNRAETESNQFDDAGPTPPPNRRRSDTKSIDLDHSFSSPTPDVKHPQRIRNMQPLKSH